MWEVVKRNRKEEKVVFGPATYSQAYAVYEEKATKYNAVNQEGEYVYDTRISIRKHEAHAT